ncbi:sulfatase [Planctellipticum variicoloris]|uniref:sulfatase family protein n=1 Tax=Planctellipticum variicoloris TaxID=3064265 RepID=UPI002CDDB884|nr:sulfatase-like hydrolase/transferase [Planctomycetaceae bacterium SH412]HTN05046.1 sulfatase-like hydrolase/transferase [Planctomycetaceae bacterium]
MLDQAVPVLRCAALCLALVLAGWSSASAADRPNILLILADDFGWGDLGSYGGKIAPTPRLDQLAAEGTRFTQFYAAAPICSPSRCGLLTGQFPGRWRLNSYLQTRAGNRCCGQADFLDAKAPSLARMLKEAGYATAHVGKWHLGGGRDVKEAPLFESYGFVESAGTWESPEPHAKLGKPFPPWDRRLAPGQVSRWERTGWMVDHSLDFIRRHKDQPWFVNLWLDDTHDPYVSAEADWNGDLKTRGKFVEVLERLDQQMGRLLDGLAAAGEDRDTLVLFLGDNGPSPTYGRERTGGLRGAKLSLYEGGIRTPLLVRWPGHVPAGAVDETTVVSAVDFVPTVCALTGAAAPLAYDSDGEDQSAALRGEARLRTRPLLWEYGRNANCFRYPADAEERSPSLAIREGEWKLLVQNDGSGVELYNLSSDAQETSNVADQQPEIVKRLTEQVLGWRKTLP